MYCVSNTLSLLWVVFIFCPCQFLEEKKIGETYTRLQVNLNIFEFQNNEVSMAEVKTITRIHNLVQLLTINDIIETKTGFICCVMR